MKVDMRRSVNDTMQHDNLVTVAGNTDDPRSGLRAIATLRSVTERRRDRCPPRQLPESFCLTFT